MRIVVLIFVLFFVVSLNSCTKDVAIEEVLFDEILDDALLSASDGVGRSFFKMPDSDDYSKIPQDPKNPITREKVELGKLLYHETGLALNPVYVMGEGTYSCASCHFAAAGFQSGLKQAIGEGGMGFGIAGEGRKPNPNYPVDSLDLQPIRTPSAMNVAYQTNILWNGQFGATGVNIGTNAQWTVGTPKEVNNLGYEGLESQAIAGIKVHRMRCDTSVMNAYDDYKDLFDFAFPGIPTPNRYEREYAGLAIAAYERTILANQSPWQRWLSGEQYALSDHQKEGASYFFGKAQCYQCHNGPALNSMEFHAIGMADLDGPGIYGTTVDDAERKGRGGFTNVPEDMYKFKVPQLYNLKDSPFFGHGGNFTSVYDVVAYKNRGVSENADVPEGQISEYFKPLNLSSEEIGAITDFIENGLRDPDLMRYQPIALPTGNCIPNNDALSKIDLGCIP